MNYTHSLKVLCLCVRISKLEMERSFKKAVHRQSAVGSSTSLEERLEIAGPSGSETRSVLPASTQQQELPFHHGPEPVG